MKKNKKPILVTGSHRSGTTWVGRMIAAAPNVAYIHEPFNLDIKLSVNPVRFKYWFQHICEDNSDPYGRVIEKILNYKYPLCDNLSKIGTLKGAANLIRKQGRCYLHKINNDRPLLKDPIAFFSAGWLCRRFNMDVVVMIRHPAAFCSSLKIKGWKFDFNNFIHQPILMKKYLSQFEADIHEYARKEKGIIEQGILLWNCIHQTLRAYKDKYPSWLYVRHEDISRNPIPTYRTIFNSLGLDFNQKARAEIMDSSGRHNPSEQQNGNEFKRNSLENIFNWKKRLSKNEITLIWEKTKHIAPFFYREHEW